MYVHECLHTCIRGYVVGVVVDDFNVQFGPFVVQRKDCLRSKVL
jgi:hypothetical protein